VPEQYGDAMAVTDEAISRIKQMIISGELAPGDRLPPEKELSENLGLSRSSMREAIKALEVIRVLNVRQGDGTYVTSLDARLLIEAISFVMELQSDIQIIETLVVRRICEGAAVGMAAARITPDQIASLRQFIEDSLPTGSVEELVAHDLEFHARIVASSGNSYLAALVESLSSKTVRARIWRGITQSNAVGRTLEEHRSIVDALATGDAKLAESLTVAHIAGVEHWLRENIG
jgi:GntR family transcriptional repressor for pyruvate dehydrogenase complex